MKCVWRIAIGICASLACAASYGAPQSLAATPNLDLQPASASSAAPILLVHGGAGALTPDRYTPAEEQAFLIELERALRSGFAELKAGRDALDAVETTIVALEDSPLFNAGRGSVFTFQGDNALDAAIMNGADLEAGAVAGLQRVKNPIRLARKVMEQSEHVFLAGRGAERFAKKFDVEMVRKRYFRTQARWRAFKRASKAEKKRNSNQNDYTAYETRKFGTVGAVAMDSKGNLAAGTSTGGTLLKRYGRIGDSPIIGAGVYADNRSCAVSATGEGEYFIRLTIARDICAQIEYSGVSVEKAAYAVINKRLTRAGGQGGVIVLDGGGRPAFAFNTDGMFRGWITEGSPPIARMYGDREAAP